MKSALLVCAAVGAIAACGGEEEWLAGRQMSEPEATLANLAEEIEASAETLGSSVRLSAVSAPPFSIRLTLTNASDQSWEATAGELPWRGAGNRFDLVAVRGDGEELSPAWPIADVFDFRKISLERGSSISGVLDLRGRFAGLEAARRRGAVHVLWIYPSKSEDTQCRSAGVVEL